jgi:hypothetical protein
MKSWGFGVERRNDDRGWAMLRFDDCRLMLDRSIDTDPNAPRRSVLYLYPEGITRYDQQVRRSGLAGPAA